MAVGQEKPVESIKVTISGVKIEIGCTQHRTVQFFKDYLSSFDRPDYTISVSGKEIDAERRVISLDIADSVTSITTDSDAHVELSIIYRRIVEVLPRFAILLMHGAVVSTDNEGYMFTAPSGTGKSTRAKLWLEEFPRSSIVNGDKPFIRVTDHDVIASGTPWCGKEGWNTNISVPLRAIFLLERAAENSENRIEEVSLGKAFPLLLQQIYRPQNADEMRETVQLLKSIEGKVRLYRFFSAPTKEAMRLAYETARPR